MSFKSLSDQDEIIKPYFDHAARTRTLCKLGVLVCWIAGTVNLGISIWLVKSAGRGRYLPLNPIAKEMLPLVLNLLVTIFNETLGYVHTTSLRWALQREGHLAFNSNLRLFTSAQTSKANAWYSNALMLVCIVMSYGSTSLIFVGDLLAEPSTNGTNESDYPLPISYLPANCNVYVCGFALVTLAIGLLGQCTIATAALYSAVKVPSWSSDPINTTAACLASASISAVTDRCLRSVHDEDQPSVPVAPRAKQQSAYSAHKEVRYVFYYLWSTVALAFLWGGVLIAVISSEKLVDGMYNGCSWSFLPSLPSSVNLSTAWGVEHEDTSGTMTLAIPWKIIGAFAWQDQEHPYFSFPSFCWAFALMCLLQSFMTLGLHCAELLVNIMRDERTWRRTAMRSSSIFEKKHGLSRKSTNSVYLLLSSGPALTLFLFKPILHWMFSLAVSSYFSVGLVLRPPQIIFLATGALILALFNSWCAFWTPKGPQPAAYGHLQTLTNLIDEWPEMEEKIFWGRKEGPNTAGSNREEELLYTVSGRMTEELPLNDFLLGRRQVAHAGTSSTELDRVRFDELYKGSQPYSRT